MENTIHFDRLLKLADFLEALDQRLSTTKDPVEIGWDFRYVMAIAPPDTGLLTDAFGHACGTTACAIGYLPQVFPELVTPIMSPDPILYVPGYVEYNGAALYGIAAAHRVFGLTRRQAQILFTPSTTYGLHSTFGLPHDYTDEVTPAMVAANLRFFCRYPRFMDTEA